MDFFFIHPSDTKENLEKEFQATKKAGLLTGWNDHIPGLSSETGPCIRFPNQGQFHIMRYLQCLAQAIVRMGGKIFQTVHKI